MDTYNLHGVEIFAAGTWNGDVYTVDDLQEMVRAFSELGFRPPIKAGHTDIEPKDKAGMPALGWLENLRVHGNKLLADLTHMPQLVYEAIRNRRYNTVSAEIYWNLERAGKKFKRAFAALSLLGADIPAVDLRPLHEFFSLAWGGAKSYAELPSADAKMYESDALSLFNPTIKKGNTMSDDVTKDLQALKAQYAEITAQLKAASDAAEKRAKAAEDSLAAIKTKYEEEQKASAARVAALEAERRKHALDEVAGKCVVPALRPFIRAFQDVATLVPGVKSYNAKNEEKDAAEIVGDMIAAINEIAKTKLFAVESGHTNAPIETGDDRAAIGKKVDAKVAEYRAKDPKADYRTALNAVLAGDPELKRAYAAA